MANRSKTLARALSSAGAPQDESPGAASFGVAQGRLAAGLPVAVIDIGSNSVRLVAYEGMNRAPTPVFNEKVLAGLGRGVASTGYLPQDGVEQALSALRRFRKLVEMMRIGQLFVLATAAARDAVNGPEFLAEAERVLGAKVELLSGEREAKLSALGVLSGFHRADGVAGDLGGGSLELVDMSHGAAGEAVSLKLGGLALEDASGKSLKKARKIVREAFEGAAPLKLLKGRSFYAVGGTWRNFAKLHMAAEKYPLRVIHGYCISAREAISFCEFLESGARGSDALETISSARRPLLGYGAIVMQELLEISGARDVVISALGVREGLIYEKLSAEEQNSDPLITAAMQLNILRSRSPRHGEDLADWTDAFMLSLGIEESADELRLRHAACLLADIGWRAHPDYRGEQSLNIIAHAGFAGIDHPGRAYLALSVFFRHAGLNETEVSPRLAALAKPKLAEKAKLLGALMRVAYLVSAAMPGVLPRTPVKREGRMLVLELPADLAPLASERLMARLKGLAKVSGLEAFIRAA